MPNKNHPVSHRPLGYVEHIYRSGAEFGAFVAVRIVRISGPLTADVLQTSLQDVQNEIALLRASMTGRGELQVSTTADVPLNVVQRRSPEQWKEMATAALLQRFPDGSLLWRAWFLESADGQNHELLFAFHHSISDGSAITWLVNRVVQKCQARLKGQTIQHAAQPLPAAADKSLPGLGIGRAIRFAWHHVIKMFQRNDRAIQQLVQSPWVSADDRTTTIRFLTLPTDSTARLLTTGKRERSTVEGTLMAAMLRASSTMVGKTTKPFMCFTSVNLRPVCQVEPDLFGCFVYWAESLQPVRPDGDFWDLARQTSSGIQRSKQKRGLPPPALFKTVSGRVLRGIVNNKAMGRTNAVGVSNLGKIDLLDDFTPLRVTEMYSLAAQQAIGNAAHLIGGSVSGRIMATLMFTSPIPEAAADTFVKDFQAVLEAACLAEPS